MQPIALGLLAFAKPASADVVSVGSNGFAVENRVSIDATPTRVYAALAEIGRWWSPSHSYSGDAANLKLNPIVGGCMCETWDGNEIEHMRVVYAQPPGRLWLRGALGPLQGEGADGALTYRIDAGSGAGTRVVMTYVVGGYARGGFEKLAPRVDQVLGEQLRRLDRYIESGSPEAAESR